MDSIVGLGFNRFRQNPLKFDLKCHGVGTTLMCHKKFTVTFKYTFIKSHMVVVIIAMKSNIKFVEEETVLLFRVALGLFSFSNHAVVHSLSSFQGRKIKSTRRRACLSASLSFLCRYLLA